MDLIDKIQELSTVIPKQLEHIQTEEATKTALIMPFINALGYNVFDPSEVVPELTADIGTKKGEKVDYAIYKDGKPIILIECKCQGCDLDKEHASQLYRYFTVTEARFAILTNGLLYRFYTDLEEPNKMDSKPFFEFNMTEIKEPLVDELKKFSKSAFDQDNILATASELKYTKEIKRIMADEMNNPSDEFTRFFASSVYTGRMTHAVKQQFTSIVKHALYQFINDRISDRLKSALAEESQSDGKQLPPNSGVDEGVDSEKLSDDQKIVTTVQELEGYYIVKSILREIVDVKRLIMRDGISFCSVLLDDTNRKPICRFRFDSAKTTLGVFNEQRQEEKFAIEDINDIYNYADRLKIVIQHYEAI